MLVERGVGMCSRLLKFSKNHSFFLFGPRGTGKSTLLHSGFDPQTTLWLDLLDLEIEEQFLQTPGKLYIYTNNLKIWFFCSAKAARLNDQKRANILIWTRF
jgi:predicted kinase